MSKSRKKILKKYIEIDLDSEDDLLLVDLISNLHRCENWDVSEISEWLNNNKTYEVTDSSVVVSFKFWQVGMKFILLLENYLT